MLGTFFSMKKKIIISQHVGDFWNHSYTEYENNSDRNETHEEYHNKFGQYLIVIINNLKKSDTWKILIRIAINFISSEDNDEEHVMHSKGDNIENMINEKADQVIEKPFNHFLVYI